MLHCVNSPTPMLSLRQSLTAAAVAFVLLPVSAAAVLWRSGLRATELAFAVDPFEVDLQLYDRNDD